MEKRRPKYDGDLISALLYRAQGVCPCDFIRTVKDDPVRRPDDHGLTNRAAEMRESEWWAKVPESLPIRGEIHIGNVRILCTTASRDD